MGKRSVDLVIPVYKPDGKLRQLLEAMEAQSLAPAKIILALTVSGDGRQAFERDFPRWAAGGSPGLPVEIWELPVGEFDHATARNKGASLGSSEYVLFMTQDAVPADGQLVEALAHALEEPDVAVAYARQLAAEDAHPLEKAVREFNYPEESCRKRIGDLERLGVKAFFCSNVCAMYKRRLWEDLGCFAQPALFNEDMVFAAAALAKGYAVAYQAGAAVVHSHNYGFFQQFSRNFDLGASQACHPEVFAGLSSEREGARLLAFLRERLWKPGSRRWFLLFLWQALAKYAGYLAGRRHKIWPLWLKRRWSSLPGYWQL